MPELNPHQSDGTPERTYAEELREKGVGHIRGGQTWNTKDQAQVSYDAAGKPVAQTITDQNGHEVTEHASGRVDVNINLR